MYNCKLSPLSLKFNNTSYVYQKCFNVVHALALDQLQIVDERADNAIDKSQFFDKFHLNGHRRVSTTMCLKHTSKSAQNIH